ncbi:prepilin-type N-terminal cleavage/methylation domain-containing protein [Dechloromonas sp. TW-R-39-2]|uniref:PilW family protein n=1 Tax=Dechloromonas sp. TW-R-39-2 TaxID=2654218 RepID=UPI00193D17B8|nr:PilW family protein [Dechloromonas sp. TW-R-39-2]QRM18025.1 prepilin-type N-terminal cleavage/methylation domain-containing protein [Dechloromonas sp. TW-R-39-2]
MTMFSRSQRGLSLVELMVGMTIALVAVAAATSMYAATRQTSRVQASQARLAEDGRFAIFMLQRIIGQAGYRPPDGAKVIQPLISNYLTPDATTAATKAQVRFTGDTANVSSIDCAGALVSGAQVLTISGTGGTLSCTNAANTATNWIAASASGTGGATELVDFKLEYGTDRWGPLGNGVAVSTAIGCGAAMGSGLARDCVADTYDEAIAIANPANIIAVKACLVLRAEAVDGAITKSAAVTNCSGGSVANSQTDKKLYRTFRTTILLRNR